MFSRTLMRWHLLVVLTCRVSLNHSVPGTPALVTCCRRQVTREGPEQVPRLLPRDSVALQYVTTVAPVTSDSKYDFSCQAADREQNVIYC